jgi:hypothetical protein
MKSQPPLSRSPNPSLALMHTNPQKQFSSSDSGSPAMKEESGVS